ncbi:tonB-system energizer ExbB [Dongia sp.]|uniref:tonB-system energizer ExbB n=1 Tax=Dongia sp. TaxID=1977262 RepID=UPI0035AD9600
MKITCLLIACGLSLAALPATAQEVAPPQPAAPLEAASPAPTVQADGTAAAVPTPAPEIAPNQAGEPILLGPDGQPLPAEAAAILPHDLSPWGMFMQADWIVKGVMIGLALASIVTWTVWLVTSLELMAAKRRARHLRAHLAAAPSLVSALGNAPAAQHAGAELMAAAAREVDLSADLPADGIKERIASRLERIEAAAARYATRGTGILATIGSTAPFVGLFGTVWGIMNAFIGISKAQTTNLAVVAPGIAEALLATAIGLVAAIPAVVIYNKFSRSISGYRALLADISAELLRLVSRDLDRARAGQPAAYRDAAE